MTTPCHHAARTRCIPDHPALIFLPTTPTAPGRDWEDGWSVEVHAHIHPGAPATRTDPADPGEIELLAAVDVNGKDWLPAVMQADAVRAAEVAALSGVARCVAVPNQWACMVEEVGTFADAGDSEEARVAEAAESAWERAGDR